MLPGKVLSVQGFKWDAGNLEKNWLKHGVSPLECEEVFFNQPLVVAPDEKHSQQEERYYALGRTNNERHLFLVFTVQGRHIRVISARDMNKRERNIYGT